MTKDKYIIVNATALDRSGGLSILNQFVENIPESELQWLIFIPENVYLSNIQQNIRIEPISGVKPMHKRLWWDTFGLNRWLKNHTIDPIACISLQNTGFKVSKKDIPHFIYYHQSIPFFPNKWNPVKKGHRTLWFYKNIYPFFVKLFLHKNTSIFVQLDFIKNGFIKRFNHSEDKVKVYSPSVSKFSRNTECKISLSEGINIFYPATDNFYKNHSVLFDAIKKFEEGVQLYVTIPTDEKNVSSIGVVPFEQVYAMYKKCDALVFPSYIETFGLPLLEAALTGMQIIAADLPYAREVLTDYEGVTFIQYDSSEAWRVAISNLKKGQRFPPIDISNRPGWKELFEDIQKSLSKYVSF